MSTLKSLTNHLKVLEKRHRELDKQVTKDYEHHLDDTQLANEKIEKLHLKREISQLEKQIKELENGNK